MPALTTAKIAEILLPFCASPSALLLDQLSLYLDLLLRWNERTNLTAIRQPEAIVARHFGESLFLASHLPPFETLLDLGSGAGFPGLPVQLLFPLARVTLAESQQKKCSFLREVIRTLELKTEVWPGRVEAMVSDRRFDVVTLRAVDAPDLALQEARRRVTPRGVVAHLTTGELEGEWTYRMPLPGRGVLQMFHVEHSAAG